MAVKRPAWELADRMMKDMSWGRIVSELGLDIEPDVKGTFDENRLRYLLRWKLGGDVRLFDRYNSLYPEPVKGRLVYANSVSPGARVVHPGDPNCYVTVDRVVQDVHWVVLFFEWDSPVITTRPHTPAVCLPGDSITVIG